jgi:hypothetical protein
MSGAWSSAVRPHSKRETRRVSRLAISEELLLRAVFVGEELDVVDEQHVGLPVALAETHQRIVLDGIDKVVREGFTSDVDDLDRFPLRQNRLPDGVHEVRFA